jgi:26S proteasome regulatory subunit N5
VENERARLTKKLADIYEGQDKIKEAAEILQELQVETYGTMDRREKIEFLLEQMRLCLAKQDYIRTQIISKKINTKAFDDASTQVRSIVSEPSTHVLFSPLPQELKLKYYKLMIEMDLHDKNYFDVCQHYQQMYQTASVQQDSQQMKQALKHVVLYLTLSPFNNEQSDFLHRLSLDKNLEQVPKYKFVSSDMTDRFESMLSNDLENY